MKGPKGNQESEAVGEASFLKMNPGRMLPKSESSGHGGRHLPNVAHWPVGIKFQNFTTREPCHLIDLATLELAGCASYPKFLKSGWY